MDADGRGADERRDVAGHAPSGEAREPLAEGRPVDDVTEVGLPLHDVAAHLLRVRTRGPALAEDLEGHALSDVALRAAVLHERGERPREHVDEAGRDGELAAVELEHAALPQPRRDGRDAVAGDGDVADERLAATAVDDETAAEHDVRFSHAG